MHIEFLIRILITFKARMTNETLLRTVREERTRSIEEDRKIRYLDILSEEKDTRFILRLQAKNLC